MTCPTRLSTRRGFTLVEVLTVMLIIGLLIAILLPAVNSAVNTARDAAVTAEMNQLAQALTTFKNQYGDYPPSRIILNENTIYDTTSTAALSSITWYSANTTGVAQYNGSDDLTYGQLAARSLTYLRKFWPRAAALQSGGASRLPAFQSSTGTALTGTTPVSWPDFNGNGVCDQTPILLQGNECLVFFLGGIPNQSSSTTNFAQGGAMTGFARDPISPLVSDSNTTTRTQPLFEFKADRLVDDDLDGIPGYIDTLGSATGGTATYYAYFNSYGTTATSGGYDPNDNNYPAESGIVTTFRTAFPAGVSGSQSNVLTSPSPNPYTSSIPDPTSASLVSPATYLNAQTFQIISAGRDRVFGFGGQYLSNSPGERLPVNPGMTGTYQGTSLSDRAYERDNLTNFNGARLE